MAISIAIILISTGLFVYWFRYTCLLILSTQDRRSFARQVAEANRLSFPAAQEQLSLEDGRDEALDRFHQSLDRDYRLVRYLLRNAGTHSTQTLEEHLLRLDYMMMRAAYVFSRPFSPSSARSALLERASIISYLASTMSDRVAIPS